MQVQRDMQERNYFHRFQIVIQYGRNKQIDGTAFVSMLDWQGTDFAVITKRMSLFDYGIPDWLDF